jgi:hypothetical protein
LLLCFVIIVLNGKTLLERVLYIIDVTYNDTTGKLDLVLNTNYLQDTAAGILTHNDHIGVTATYNNANNRLSLEVTGGGGGSGGSSNASLSDMWWLGV